MALKKLFFVALFALVVLSCSKDDEPKNNAPTIADKAFTVKENIAAGDPIGTLTASDKDGDALTFSIAANDNALFAITAKGALSLATGKSLDFETAAKHTISVSVNDGEATAKATITINVTDVDEETPVEENSAPTIEAQSFDVTENIGDADSFGTVSAQDADIDDILTFSMTDESGLFEITEAGELSLVEGKELDFEALENPTINVTVQVTDQKDSAQAQVTINVTNVNEAPEIESTTYEFDVAEDISDTEAIGTKIAVTDPEGDALEFTITEGDNNGLFEVNADGELSLAPGKNLDYETMQSHELTISVSDGEFTAAENITITINVTNVIETLLEDPTSFITTWKTDNPGTSSSTQIIIPTYPGEIYNYTIYWEEVGNPSHNGMEEGITSSITIEFGSMGTYRIAITGTFPHIFFNDELDAEKILSVDQWGTNPWGSMENAFSSCANLTIPAIDMPDLSNVTNMHSMFAGASSFNSDISGWDVFSVTNIGFMFYGATAFNQDIGNWDVSNVINMAGMFWEATNFNKYIGNWDVSNVTHMQSMFSKAESFNQDISNWNVFNVENMNLMFYGATKFNQPLNWGEKTAKVNSMIRMFNEATSFNQDISGWDVSSVTSMAYMFNLAELFNQDISGWDVSSVKDMSVMFSGANKFNQSLGNWDITSVTNMIGFFSGGLSAENYGATLVGWATQEPGEGPIPTNITLGASGLIYCSNDSEVTVARNNLLGAPLNWDIQGDTGVTCNE
ncbi:MAG: BspA family leucine-rich repeat surface protein [Algicola sp.]|nr:BspA family leucine-rich repeat surface protein [Algicola sp.]